MVPEAVLIHDVTVYQDMLKWDSVNCIAMEWKAGVRAPYAQAANNARVVAAQVAHMINFLMVSLV